jgi:pyruvate/2-oxoglutarate dehydrogenase complex dihydrolipoamide acyltransferase (E2) component
MSRFASPQARDLAAELRLDTEAIEGSGKGGAVTLADVRQLAPPEPPDDLREAGAELWREVRARWDLRPDESSILLAACRTLDETADLEAALEGQPAVVVGSKGQPRPNPLYAEIRAHRLALRALLDSIGISEAVAEGGNAEAERSHAGRRLARQRWSKRRG